MTDESTQTPAAGASPASAGAAGGLKGFFATTLGKVVIIGGAVVVLIAVLAVVGTIVMGTLLGGTTEDLTNQVPVKPAAAGASQAPTAPVAPVPDVTNDDIFTPRDPFRQILLPASALQSGTSGSGSSSHSNTLTLVEITSDNGTPKAVLTLDGTTYTVGAGERLGTTSWQVVSIGTSSVVMLFGDSRMTLSVGQGIQAK